MATLSKQVLGRISGSVGTLPSVKRTEQILFRLARIHILLLATRVQFSEEVNLLMHVNLQRI